MFFTFDKIGDQAISNTSRSLRVTSRIATEETEKPVKNYVERAPDPYNEFTDIRNNEELRS